MFAATKKSGVVVEVGVSDGKSRREIKVSEFRVRVRVRVRVVEWILIVGVFCAVGWD